MPRSASRARRNPCPHEDELPVAEASPPVDFSADLSLDLDVGQLREAIGRLLEAHAAQEGVARERYGI